MIIHCGALSLPHPAAGLRKEEREARCPSLLLDQETRTLKIG